MYNLNDSVYGEILHDVILIKTLNPYLTFGIWHLIWWWEPSLEFKNTLGFKSDEKHLWIGISLTYKTWSTICFNILIYKMMLRNLVVWHTCNYIVFAKRCTPRFTWNCFNVLFC